MPQTLKLSSRLFSKIFWEKVLEESDSTQPQKSALSERLNDLESLRLAADYNTGSISFISAWCLFNLVRHFRLKRAIEVGTFIGKSTISMAMAMDELPERGEIFTCDVSNTIELPKQGKTLIKQYPKTGSSEMLKSLSGAFDFLFLDGRLSDQDINLLSNLLTPDSIIALDDFEGIEKGVFNLFKLRELDLLKSHFLVYPVNELKLRDFGFTSHSLIAVLFPISRIELVAQG